IRLGRGSNAQGCSAHATPLAWVGDGSTAENFAAPGMEHLPDSFLFQGDSPWAFLQGNSILKTELAPGTHRASCCANRFRWGCAGRAPGGPDWTEPDEGNGGGNRELR